LNARVFAPFPENRLMPSRRTKGITIKVTDEEYAACSRLAHGQTVSAWVHEVVLATTTPRPVDHILLAEVLALRTIVLNLLFAVVSGETPTADAMKRLIQRADDAKIRKAESRLAEALQGGR
jgi:hypothetical protein